MFVTWCAKKYLLSNKLLEFVFILLFSTFCSDTANVLHNYTERKSRIYDYGYFEKQNKKNG